MKDSKGHGSNSRGNNRADTIARGKAIDEKRYPTTTPAQRSALADAGLPAAPGARVAFGQSANAAQMALVAAKLNLGAHQGALHAATVGKKL
jgi:hypothetical protein